MLNYVHVRKSPTYARNSRGAHVHSGQIERWLGREETERVSAAARSFYWPVAVHGVPGDVHVMPGGDFAGRLDAGSEASALDRAADILNRERVRRAARLARHAVVLDRGKLLWPTADAFTSLSAIVAAKTGGKGCDMWFAKAGVASSAIGGSMDLWGAAGLPAAGAAGSAAPGGKVWSNADAGTMGFVNAVANANTSVFISGYVTGSVIANTLLLYDRLMSVVKTMNSTATEAVTGVPTRYTSQTTTNKDYIGGNFCFPSNPTTVLAATAHNWTVCQYTDQGGNTAQSFPSATGISACPVRQIDLAVGSGSWFMPLASGDFGVKALTQMQASAAVATGTIDFVVGHPIAWLACPVANMVCNVDGINTAFSLAPVFDGAALALLEAPKPATTATSYSGQVSTVSE